MALLERINSMKQQGFSEAQIQNSLTNEGVSPREIMEAISQAKIKDAVTSESDMQPSIGSDQNTQQFMAVPESSTPSPTMQQYSQKQAQPVYQQQSYDQQAAPQQYEQQAYSQQQYDQQAYAQQGYDSNAYAQQAYAPQGLDIETVRDISKQQVEESLKKLKAEISELSKLKSELNFEIQDIESRLKKVEDVMHELQSAIIRKMGEYGESIQGISQEIRATQDSFAKVINPLMDKKRGITREYSEKEQEREEPEETREVIKKTKITETQESNRPKPKKAPEKSGREGNSASFEDYFR